MCYFLQMIVFIDESGDPGFRVSKGSSKHFVIVLIVFYEEIDAEETALQIKKLKKSLGKKESFEFKFNKCNKEYREKFLKTVQKCNFHIRAIVFNKELVYSNHLKQNKERFYNFALRMVLEHSASTIQKAKIRLDGSGEREFRKQLTTYLRRFLNNSEKKIVENIRFRDSQTDVLIQLADMIAGSIRRYFDHTTNDWEVYRKIFKKKEEDVWKFK